MYHGVSIFRSSCLVFRHVVRRAHAVLLWCVLLVLSFWSGPVARWMAVKASAGNKITDNVGPLEVTAGDDSSACHESFKAVRKIHGDIQHSTTRVAAVHD